MNRTSSLSWLGLLLVLGCFAVAVWQKETSLAQGRTVILELMPQDPRSLMQGDYMVLRYRLLEQVEGSPSEPDQLYLQLDTRQIASELFWEPGPGRVPVNFRRRGARLEIGAESFFFQEGQGELYQRARYGQLKVDPTGACLLIDLLDESLTPLRPSGLEPPSP